MSLGWLSTLRPRQTTCGIMAAGEFGRALEVEQLRTNQSGLGFCLLVLTVPPGCENRRCVAALASALLRRLRTTDIVGWLGEGRIGVLLPYTSADGAWVVANKLCWEVPTEIRPPACAVYTHHQWADASAGTRKSRQRPPSFTTLQRA
jgi:hypothetical protein